MRMLVLLLGVVFAANAYAGGGTVGNGGDIYAIEFVETARDIYNDLKEGKARTISLSSFRKAIDETHVESTEEQLLLNGVLKDAINYPLEKKIVINRDAWSSQQNARTRYQFVIHEYLGIMGVDDSRYDVSVKLLNSVVKKETKTYAQGQNKYTVVASERFVEGRFFDSVRIDYQVFKNGKRLVLETKDGGTMYSCNYENPKLPEDFVEVLSEGSSNLGFLIKGLGICGNTTSKKYHVIIPRGDAYQVKEIVSKAEPILRPAKKGVEFWYLYQEWGACGTAGSFFVPAVFLINGPRESFAIDLMKLPSDINLIPAFTSFPMENYMSLFTAGLRTHDWQLMNLATSYFDKKTVDRYEWCGLPVTPAEAQKQSEAMKSLGSILDVFPGK